MGPWLKFLAVSVFLFMLIPFSVPWVTATNGDAVPSGIVEAEETLVSAYDAVLEAEDSGANVSSLLDRLSVGGEYLAEAYNYFRLGDSENAGRLAGLCVEAVDGVEAEAVLLRDETVRLEKEDFLVNVFGSAVGVVIVVVSGFVLWGIFKRRYYAKVLDSKPEVVSGEA